MKATKRTQQEARRLVRLCRTNGSLDDGRIRQVVERVIEAKDRGYLALLSEFERLVRLDLAEHTAEVATAAPLPDDLQATVRKRLQETYGQGIEVRFSEMPELIGGMRIQVGCDVYDGSVRSKLAALEDSFQR